MSVVGIYCWGGFWIYYDRDEIRMLYFMDVEWESEELRMFFWFWVYVLMWRFGLLFVVNFWRYKMGGDKVEIVNVVLVL